MTKKRLLVIGAAGDVGQGVVAAVLDAGHAVAAAGRSSGKLDAIAARHPGAAISVVAGDVSTVDGAAKLFADASAALGGVDAVVVSVNAPAAPAPILGMDDAGLADVFAANVLTHFNAAKAILPRLAPNAIFIGIGGGMADFAPPQMAHVSMTQAALRMVYRGLSRETKKTGPIVKELMVVSMVNGESKRDIAEADWLTDLEIGRHVCAVLSDPSSFPDAILKLTSREQVGALDAF